MKKKIIFGVVLLILAILLTLGIKNYVIIQSLEKKFEEYANKDNYHIYNRHSNSKIDIRYLSDGAFVINNGMLFAFTNPVSYKWITIDINGKNKMPNRWGWDLFTFELVKGDILPVGAPGTTATPTAMTHSSPTPPPFAGGRGSPL